MAYIYDISYILMIISLKRAQSRFTKNNMAEQGEQSDSKIKVTVKTPRDKKEVHVERNGSIRQV